MSNNPECVQIAPRGGPKLIHRYTWKALVTMAVAVLMVMLIAATLSAAPTDFADAKGTAVAANSGAPKVDSNYVGSGACKGCHFDQWTTWSNTYHAKMIRDAKEDANIVADLSKLPEDGKALWEKVRYAVGGNMTSQRFLIKGTDGLHTYFPYSWDLKTKKWAAYKPSVWETGCASCHTVGFNPDSKKFVEPGIGCEACHGPGKAHILSRGDKTKISMSIGNESCDKCHGKGRQGEELATMGHSTSVSQFVGAGKYVAYNQKAGGSCFGCHSTEYRLSEGAKPQLAEVKTSISCNACHDAHENNFEAQLREEKEALCADCHNSEIKPGTTYTPGTAVHHPQKEMNEGWGAIGVSNTPAVHYKVGATCVDCHMTTINKGPNHKFAVVTPEEALEKNMKFDSCTGCHTTSDREIRQSYINFWQGNVKKKVSDLQALVDAAKAKVAVNPNLAPEVKALYDTASTNLSMVVADASKGAHNYEYAMKILGAVEKNIKAFNEKTK